MASVWPCLPAADHPALTRPLTSPDPSSLPPLPHPQPTPPHPTPPPAALTPPLLCSQADETLGKFLDYCTYGHMIDNVVLIVTGTLHERDVQVRGSCRTQRRPGAPLLPHAATSRCVVAAARNSVQVRGGCRA